MKLTILLGPLSIAACLVGAAANDTKCVMQHVVFPPKNLASPITHVIMAFLRSDVFLPEEPPEEYPLFMPVEEVRNHFESDTKVTVAIGGWGDTEGWQIAARTRESRKKWAEQVKIMVDRTGADGIDIDWEYPGGNRDDYKEVPNSERVWEIEAFVKLLQQLRRTLGRNKLLTVATPGQEVDLIAYTHKTVPRIIEEVDFINVMTYDLMTRRHKTTNHHSGIQQSRDSIQRYMDRGAPAEMLNLGLGYYVKWFYTTDDCSPEDPIGCPTLLLEDPETGADLGRTGGFSWHDEVPEDVIESFARAQADGMYTEDGSYGYWDEKELRWWTFDTPKSIAQKMYELVHGMKLGGVFAWGLGEDAPAWNHLTATVKMLECEEKEEL
ncbi:uncharacterized protein J7T54_004085 [Emericellopsis cladophorae]|uniref:chitinase n=1 Tax=Emericellopsis cladophorae TaxID=2686198 RepID=A0A9Q0BDE9_9HYPO|nr:uncharacterized protein J7T54_004085 [Emericellopsis cladophorae]KAI6781312.1 hypothetical protein J7T54_004085 [Emericellopsis cladophorae]